MPGGGRLQPVARGGRRAQPAAKCAAGPLGQGTGELAAEVRQGAEQVKGEAPAPQGLSATSEGNQMGKDK